MSTKQSNINRLTAAVAFSSFGSALTEFAIPLYAVEYLKASPFEMGLLSTIGTLPHILFGLVAGGLIKNELTKRLLVRTDVARAFLVLILAIVTLSGHTNLYVLYAIAFFVGTATLFFDVSYYSFVPLVVERQDLVQANSKIETGRQTSSLLGDSVVGVLVQFAGFSAAFFINSVTFLLSAVSVCLIRWNADVSAENTRETPNDEQTVFQRVWMGFSYIVSNKIVLILTVSGALYNFSTTMLFAMYAYHASNNLKLSLSLIAITFAISSVGHVIGAYLAEYTQKALGYGATIISGYFTSALCLIVIPFAGGEYAVYIISAALLGAGIGSMQAGIIQLSLRQAIVPKELSTTVNAAVRFILWGVLPFAGVLSGFIASRFDVRTAMIVAATGLIAAAILPLVSPIRGLKVLPTAD